MPTRRQFKYFKAEEAIDLIMDSDEPDETDISSSPSDTSPHQAPVNANTSTGDTLPHLAPVNANTSTGDTSPHQAPVNANTSTGNTSPHQAPANANTSIGDISPHQAPVNAYTSPGDTLPHQAPANANTSTGDTSPHQAPVNANTSTGDTSPHQAPVNAYTSPGDTSPHQAPVKANTITGDTSPHQAPVNTNTSYNAIIMEVMEKGSESSPAGESHPTFLTTEISSPSSGFHGGPHHTMAVSKVEVQGSCISLAMSTTLASLQHPDMCQLKRQSVDGLAQLASSSPPQLLPRHSHSHRAQLFTEKRQINKPPINQQLEVSTSDSGGIMLSGEQSNQQLEVSTSDSGGIMLSGDQISQQLEMWTRIKTPNQQGPNAGARNGSPDFLHDNKTILDLDLDNGATVYVQEPLCATDEKSVLQQLFPACNERKLAAAIDFLRDDFVTVEEGSESSAARLTHRQVELGPGAMGDSSPGYADSTTYPYPLIPSSDQEEMDEFERKRQKKNEQRNFASDMKQIYQISVSKTDTHNKRQMCPLCRVPQSNFVTHLTNVHKDEEEVQAFMALPTKDKERGRLISLMRYTGNHFNNLETLKAKQGMFIPEKRIHGIWKVSDYSPCPKCHKWLNTQTMWRHRQTCAVTMQHPDPHPEPLSEILLQSDILAGKISSYATNELKNEVFSMMYNDEIARVAKNDQMIVMMGNSAMNRCIGNPTMRRYNVSGVIRLISRLLLELRLLQPTEELKKNLTLFQAIHPSQYENFIKAVFNVCGEEEVAAVEDEGTEQEQLKAPSNALKLSYDVQKLCRIKTMLAIDDTDKERGHENRKCTKRFMDKFTASWEIDVKKKARHVLRERKLNVMNQLPDPEDIAKLAKNMQMSMEDVKKPATYQEYRGVQNKCLSRLIAFNRRRPGDVQTMKMVQYAQRTKGLEGVHPSLIEELDDSEKQLVASQDVIEIRGKKDKKVPTIVPPDSTKALEYITDKHLRHEFGIHSPYVFASNSAGQVLRGYHAMKLAVNSCNDLRAPHLLIATRMRKMMACVCQVMALKETDVQQVLNHLGHTFDVHRDYYQHYHTVSERLDIAKLLLIQDQNRVSEYKHKRLDDIRQVTFREIIPVGQEATPNYDDPEEAVHPALDFDDDDIAHVSPPQQVLASKRSSDNIYDFEDTDTAPQTTKKCKKRFNWNDEHEEELENEFREFIDTHNKLPPGREIEERVLRCESLAVAFRKSSISVSSIKNKLIRMYPILKRNC